MKQTYDLKPLEIQTGHVNRSGPHYCSIVDDEIRKDPTIIQKL